MASEASPVDEYTDGKFIEYEYDYAAYYNNLNYDDYYYNASYDYETSIKTIYWDQLAPVVVVYGLTLILGLVGNILVIFCVARYRRMRNITNVFLISLACADLLLVLICVPVKLATWFSFTWDFGEFMCKTVHYLQTVSMICSVVTLTSMSLERYYAILWPIQAKFLCTMRHARVVVICVWVVSFVLSVPILIGQKHIPVGDHSVRITFWCIKEWSHKHWAIVYEVYMLIILYVLPLVIMTFAYSNICSELWLMTSKRASLRAPRSNSQSEEQCIDMENGHSAGSSFNKHMSGRSLVVRRQSSRNHDDENTRKQVIKMLVSVIVLYAICWGPYLFDNVLVAIGVLDSENHGWLKPMRHAFHIMAYFNSCINPIVYGFMSKNFRESFKKSLLGCCKPVIRTRSVKATSTCTRQVSLKTNAEINANKRLILAEDINKTPDTSMVDEAL